MDGDDDVEEDDVEAAGKDSNFDAERSDDGAVQHTDPDDSSSSGIPDSEFGTDGEEDPENEGEVREEEKAESLMSGGDMSSSYSSGVDEEEEEESEEEEVEDAGEEGDDDFNPNSEAEDAVAHTASEDSDSAAERSDDGTEIDDDASHSNSLGRANAVPCVNKEARHSGGGARGEGVLNDARRRDEGGECAGGVAAASPTFDHWASQRKECAGLQSTAEQQLRVVLDILHRSLGVSAPTAPDLSQFPGLPEDLSPLKLLFGLEQNEEFWGPLLAAAASVTEFGIEHLLNEAEPCLAVEVCRALTTSARAEQKHPPLSVEINALLCTIKRVPREGGEEPVDVSPDVSTWFDPLTRTVTLGRLVDGNRASRNNHVIQPKKATILRQPLKGSSMTGMQGGKGTGGGIPTGMNADTRQHLMVAALGPRNKEGCVLGRTKGGPSTVVDDLACALAASSMNGIMAPQAERKRGQTSSYLRAGDTLALWQLDLANYDGLRRMFPCDSQAAAMALVSHCTTQEQVARKLGMAVPEVHLLAYAILLKSFAHRDHENRDVPFMPLVTEYHGQGACLFLKLAMLGNVGLLRYSYYSTTAAGRGRPAGAAAAAAGGASEMDTFLDVYAGNGFLLDHTAKEVVLVAFAGNLQKKSKDTTGGKEKFFTRLMCMLKCNESLMRGQQLRQTSWVAWQGDGAHQDTAARSGAAAGGKAHTARARRRQGGV
jgi:hypothetical protein